MQMPSLSKFAIPHLVHADVDGPLAAAAAAVDAVLRRLWRDGDGQAPDGLAPLPRCRSRAPTGRLCSRQQSWLL